MSRHFREDIDCDEDELEEWERSVHDALHSDSGQRALRATEAALLALPEPKLIDNMLCDGKGVCAIGAVAAHRKVLGGQTWQDALASLDESEYYGRGEDDDHGTIDETAQFADEELDIEFPLAFEIAFQNDEVYAHLTDEQRYEHMLKWVRAQIKEGSDA